MLYLLCRYNSFHSSWRTFHKILKCLLPLTGRDLAQCKISVGTEVFCFILDQKQKNRAYVDIQLGSRLKKKPFLNAIVQKIPPPPGVFMGVVESTVQHGLLK